MNFSFDMCSFNRLFFLFLTLFSLSLFLWILQIINMFCKNENRVVFSRDYWFSQSAWMELIKIEDGSLAGCTFFFWLVAKFKSCHSQTSHSSHPFISLFFIIIIISFSFFHAKILVYTAEGHITNVLSYTITFHNVRLYYKRCTSSEQTNRNEIAMERELKKKKTF